MGTRTWRTLFVILTTTVGSVFAQDKEIEVLVNDTTFLKVFVMPPNIDLMHWNLHFKTMGVISHLNENFLVLNNTSDSIRVFAVPRNTGVYYDTIVATGVYWLPPVIDVAPGTARFPISYRAVDSLSSRVDVIEIDAPQIQVTHDAIYLTTTPRDFVTFELFDLLGKAVYVSHTPLLVLHNIVPGVYFVVTRTKTRVFMRKVFLN